ncbi:MAG: beta-1,6-N-acetylglucosaminyltransferase, partial [Acidimicrobiia bacterium]
MKIAYLFTIHKNLDLFNRVFKTVYDPGDYYLIHADRRADAGFHQGVREFIRDYPNVYQMESLPCMYAAWSLMEVQLRGIDQLLGVGDDWRYFINLSGQDFPLRSQKHLKDFLAQSPDRNYVDVQDPVKVWPRALIRARYYYLELRFFPLRPIWIPIKRRFLPNVKYYAGSAWVTLTRDFCEWLLSDPEMKPFRRFFKYTLCPNEAFLQTAIMHSPFKSTVVNHNMRVIHLAG